MEMENSTNDLGNKTLVNKTLVNKTLVNKTLGNKTLVNKTLGNKTLGNKTLAIKEIYNPEASDNNIKIFGGETTNILNLIDIKYQWAHNIFDKIFSNNWLPHKTPMQDDKICYRKLSEAEKNAYDTILCFLIFLDSEQTNNIPNISKYITAPDVVYVLARQEFDEALHSKSYGWILTSIFGSNLEKALEIIYRWKTDRILAKRNEVITDWYNDFNKNPTERNFIKVCVANYLLEGLYFYNGFIFFHNLASRGLMIGTDTQIRYIQRDEVQHCLIFENILKEIQKENPELFESMIPEIYEMFEIAVDQEIEFSKYIIGDQILGITGKSIEDYSKHLGNLRLSNINLKKIFGKVKNPYIHLEKISGVDDETSNRSNNFETNSIAYKNASAIDGWDEI